MKNVLFEYKKYFEVNGILWKIKQIMQHVLKNTINFLVA